MPNANNSTSLFNFSAGNGYISLPITTDAPTLQANALKAIAAALPGWIPRESHIEVLLLEQFAAMVAETAQVAAQVPQSIFVFFGSLVGINPLTGSPASAVSTWAMTDAKGYTIPIGTQIGYQVLGDQVYVFETTQTFTIPQGQIQAVGVPIQATVNGSSYNSLPPQDLVLINSLAFVSTVRATSTSAGGSDPETQAAFLNRLSNELQLLAPRPILPADYAAISTNVAGVFRAMAIGGLSAGRSITGATLNSGSPTLVCPTASFTQYDVGRPISDTTTPANIGAGTAIASIPNTTVASASSGTSLPEGSITVASTAGFPTSGTITIQLNANSATTVTYTGTTGGTTFTGCTGGSGTLVTGMAVYCGSQCQMSEGATGTGAADTLLLGDQTNQERTVFVCGVDVNGDALSPTTQATLQSYLLSKREVNFVVDVGTPTYSTINITFTGYAAPGSAPASVLAAATTALQGYLSPATWGGGAQTPPIWDSTQTTIHYNAVMALLGSIPGMQYIASLSIGIAGQSMGNADILMPGDAPLPVAGTLLGTVLQGT